MKRRAALMPLVVAISACSNLPRVPTYPQNQPVFTSQTVPTPRGMDTEPPRPFGLVPGDVLAFRVVGTESFDGAADVDATGSIHIPVAGRVSVGGLSLEDAERRADAALQVMDHFGHVRLAVTSPLGHRATVVGSVVRPGVLPIQAGMRLADLYALAGGARTTLASSAGEDEDDAADLEAARLVRNGQALPVSVPLALQGNPRHNIAVQPGDLLVVPPSRGQRIAVLGNVHTPRMVRFHGGLRLSQAIALAGGATERSNEGDIRVVRGSLAHPLVYTASLSDIVNGAAPDVGLAPGDVLYVTPHWFFATTGDVLNHLLPLIGAAAIAYGVFR